MTDTKELLKQVAEGAVSVEDALLTLKREPYVDMGYANLDLHRRLRKGSSEVIYGAGKNAEQIAGILTMLMQKGQDNILVTRLDQDKYDAVKAMLGTAFPETYYKNARIMITGENRKPDGVGTVAVVTAGTSDIPVAEEAAVTLEYLGNEVDRIYDVGVAGLHRLLNRTDRLMKARVLVVIAGMEGALASVVGGLVNAPVIAVPTSVGYGASFNGLSALLSMLNSCASGVSVVNIDNGFGAAYQASLINHM